MDLAIDRVFEAIALHQSLESLFAIYLLEASAEKRLGSGITVADLAEWSNQRISRLTIEARARGMN